MDGRITEGAMRAAPEGMDKMKQASVPMTWRLAVISDDEEAAQKKALGPHLKKGDQLRGVSLVYVDRSLGWTIYNPKWEDPRNVGGLRCEIICGDQVGAENFLRIQTQKHSMSFGVQHPMLQAFQNLLIGRTVICKYSHCNTLMGKAIESWDSDELCTLLEYPKEKRDRIGLQGGAEKEKEKEKSLPVTPQVTPVKTSIIDHLAASKITHISPPSVSNVTAHQRITPKSEKDVLTELMKIKALNFAPLQASAKTITESEMTELYKATQLIQAYYAKRSGV